MTISRVIAAVITAAIGIASFAVCFPAQYELASRAASIPSHLAWLWPVIIDATMVQAAVSALALSADPTAHRRPRRYFWAVLVIAALVGIGFLALDAVTATGDTINPWLDAALAGVAPVALVASTRGLALLIRARHTPIATTTHPR